MHAFRASAVLACSLMAPVAWIQAATPPAAPASAASAPALSIRNDLKTLLLDTQTLLNDKKVAEAKEKIKLAVAMPDKTPFETYITERVVMSAAINEDDAPGAAKSLDKVLELDATGHWLKPGENLSLMQAVGIAYYRTKDYANAASWMERNIKAGGTENSVRELRANAYLLAGQWQRGSDLINEEILASEKANEAPRKIYLEMLAQARNTLKDAAGYTRALELMVQYYPTKEHWRSLVNRVWGRPDLAVRLQLDVSRLGFYTGTPDEASDYTEYAEFAEKAGFSGEALAAFDKGVTAGQLGTGPKADAHKKLRAKLEAENAQDRKTMAADTAAALKKPDGLALFNIGLNMVGMQQFDKGLELMEKGVAKGISKHPEDARLRLAVAYAQAGNTDKAAQVLGTVSGPEGLDDLVKYWKLAIRKL